jgi:hypothetical protein
VDPERKRSFGHDDRRALARLDLDQPVGVSAVFEREFHRHSAMGVVTSDHYGW